MIEWLTDNGSCCVAAETRKFARKIGLKPLTTPVESPQSNGMTEAFVRPIKRDYVRVNPTPDAQPSPIVAKMVRSLQPASPASRALGYLSPREFIAS